MQIPEKFQNQDGTLNSDALIKSYSELEKKIGTMVSVPTDDSDATAHEKFRRATGVPADISEYPANPMWGDDDEDLRLKFLDAGLNPAQVEKIYKIADEFLSPAISEIFQSQYETNEVKELENFFGGPDKTRKALEDINRFGEKFLPADTFDSLCASSAGIRSIYAMMQNMEPNVATSGNDAAGASEKNLRDMMRDPKYWRDHDAEYIRKIESGFKKLYQ